MSLIGTVGVAQYNPTATPVVARLGQGGEQIVGIYSGRYHQACRDGTLFGITGGLTTTTAAGAATFTGLAVGNPSGSGKIVSVQRVMVAQGAALTAETEIGIMYGPGSITASLTTIFNRRADGPASVCTATAGQTITSPTAFIVMCGSGSGAITVPGIMPPNILELDGSVIIPPGYFFASYTSRVTTTALVFNFMWQELPA